MTAIARRRVASFSHAQIASLVTAVTQGVPNTTIYGLLSPIPPEAIDAKMVELKLASKNEKPALSDARKHGADAIVDAIAKSIEAEDPQGVLTARYMVKSLQALLPKRKAGLHALESDSPS